MGAEIKYLTGIDKNMKNFYKKVICLLHLSFLVFIFLFRMQNFFTTEL